MATIELKDGNGTSYYFKVTGAGTSGDPFIPSSDLTINNSSISNTNALPIETPDGKGIGIKDILVSLKNILNVLSRPLWVNSADSTLKIGPLNALTLGTVTTCSTVTTCNTVTSLSQLAGQDSKLTLLYSNERMNWNLNVRNRIT